MYTDIQVWPRRLYIGSRDGGHGCLRPRLGDRLGGVIDPWASSRRIETLLWDVEPWAKCVGYILWIPRVRNLKNLLILLTNPAGRFRESPNFRQISTNFERLQRQKLFRISKPLPAFDARTLLNPPGHLLRLPFAARCGSRSANLDDNLARIPFPARPSALEKVEIEAAVQQHSRTRY